MDSVTWLVTVPVVEDPVKYLKVSGKKSTGQSQKPTIVMEFPTTKVSGFLLAVELLQRLSAY